MDEKALITTAGSVAGRRERARAQAVSVLICAAALAMAALLRPDPRGYGTHEQLGLPACSFHRLTGLPCPGCGMTTAFAHGVRLHLLRALRANPFGALLCLGTVVWGAFSLICLITDWQAWWVGVRILASQPFLWSLAGALLLSWIFEILATLKGW